MSLSVASTSPEQAQARAQARTQLGIGRVRHQRLRPTPHAFDYPTWFLLLPLRSLRRQADPLLRRNRAGWVSFHDADHGDGRSDCLAWLDDLLAREGVADATGEVWLQAYPRMLGYAFKPVSFWFCHRPDGTLAAIVVEVNNTFGGRHVYLLAGPPLGSVGFGRELTAQKVFHVSPFCQVQGQYRFRFMRTGLDGSGEPARSVARIDHDDAQGPLLLTSVSGDLSELTAARLRRALWRMPVMALGVIARIHWQALRLLLKRVPFFGKGVTPLAAPSTPAKPTGNLS